MIIEYNDRQYQVPKWASYIAMDEDGAVFCYQDKPQLLNVEWDDKGCRLREIHEVPNGDWKDSLMKVC